MECFSYSLLKEHNYLFSSLRGVRNLNREFEFYEDLSTTFKAASYHTHSWISTDYEKTIR